jgi:hypothetical protein
MENNKPALFDYFKYIFLHVPDKVDQVTLVGRTIVFVGLFIWGWTFILHSVESNYVASSFMHNINLVFHEAGHVVFRPFGKFIMFLGGSLGQVLMPAIVMVAFLIKNRDTFGASVGQNFMDMAPYINDARDLKLPLLGGVTGQDVVDYHDWEFLLGRTGLAQYDHILGHGAHYLGTILMITAWVWGGYMLYRQYQNLETGYRGD